MTTPDADKSSTDSYVLSCCSAVDVTKEFLDKRDLKCIPFHYELDGKLYEDDFGQSKTPEQLYQEMLDGAEATTSQISVGEYLEHWRPFLEAGQDVLHVTLSSGISGTYNAACEARDMAAEEFPQRTVLVVDSLCASSGYGLLMDRLAELKRDGMGIFQLAKWTRQHRQEVQHWFFSSDLTFLVRGGRLSKAAGLASGLLKICPVMDVAPDGSLSVIEKVRTKGRAEARLVEIMHQLAQNGDDYSGKVYMCNSACLDDAKDVAAVIEREFPHIDGPIEHYNIGTTIGCHAGPGTVAVFFWGDASGRRYK